MTTAKVVLVSGPAGVGKSSVSRALAVALTAQRAAYVPMDPFYANILQGYVEPWLPEAHAQNSAIADVLQSVASAYARGGFDVVVDGVIGPWFLAPWQALARGGLDVRYVVLRPTLAATLQRASARSEHAQDALTDTRVIELLWQQFTGLEELEPHVVDTSALSLTETVQQLERAIAGGSFRLPLGAG